MSVCVCARVCVTGGGGWWRERRWKERTRNLKKVKEARKEKKGEKKRKVKDFGARTQTVNPNFPNQL